MKIAIAGCGKISGVYFKNIRERFTNLEVVACCAEHIEHAKEKAEEYKIRGCTYEEILEDESIEMVLVLTPAPTHYQLIKEALLAGKHVYTEKPIALELAQAEELKQIAEEKKRYLGAAPETFLGSGIQTAKKALQEGMIGEVTSFHMCANRDYDFLTSIFGFLNQEGGGVCYDYSVYYLTALVNLLGPVESVYGEADVVKPVRVNSFERSPEFGKTYESPNETIASAVIRLENGVMGTYMMNAESNLMDLADFRIYGTKGVLILPDPNHFGGEVKVILNEKTRGNKEIILEPVSSNAEELRGIGPAEMEKAIRENRPCRTDAMQAIHVLDILTQIMESSRSGKKEKVNTTCPVTEDIFDDSTGTEKE